MLALKVPAAHGAHARSAAAVPAALTYWPAVHVAQAVQPAAFVPALKVPAPQFAHTRSLEALPSALTNWPAAQSFHALHVR